MSLSDIIVEVGLMIERYDLDGDKEISNNGKPFWVNTVGRVLHQLRKEGILKSNRRNGYYELEEMYYENQTPYD